MQEIYHRNRELLLHELYSKILTEAAQFSNFRNRKVFLLESLLNEAIYLFWADSGNLESAFISPFLCVKCRM